MEICQHCKMYMKPFFTRPNDTSEGEASCEFCGKSIAKIIDGKWIKQEVLDLLTQNKK